MRTLVIGDVHGCIEELHELLKKVHYTYEDELVFAGDLMDRGPDPVGTVRLVRQLQIANPKVVCVQGNHEEKHIRWARHEKRRMETLKKNPMSPFDEKKLREHAQLTEDDIKWMAELPTIHKITDDWIVVHGGLEADRSAFDQLAKVRIRCRYVNPATGLMASADDPYDAPQNAVHWAEAWPGPENVIYGHFCERLGEVMIRGKATEFGQFACYGIESGCCFGGSLTAMILEWRDVWYEPNRRLVSGVLFKQVQAKAIYKAWKSGKD